MASSSSSSSTSSSTTSANSSPASAPAPSAADGALYPADAALSAADGPDLLAAPSDPAASSSTASSTTSKSSSASALAPSAAYGAHHPPNPALPAADGPNLQATPSDPPAASSSTAKDAWSALIDTIEPSKGVGRGAAPPGTASASGASTSRSLGAAASSSRAAARLPTITYETGWGGKGRVPPATGLALLQRQRANRSPRNISSPGRGRGWKTPDPTSSTRPCTCSSKNAWRTPPLPSCLAWSNSMTAAATGKPTGASYSTHPSLLTKFAGNDTSSSSAAASSTASAGPSASTPAPAAPPPPSTSVQLAPVQASPSSTPSLSDTFDWTINNYRGAGRGVLGAVAAAPAGGDAAVAADAFQNYDSWYAPDGTVEELRRQAAVDLAPLLDGFAGLGDELGHPPQREPVGDELGHPPQAEPVGEWKRCFNCLVNRADKAFSPCGHIVLCAPCYERRERCPCCLKLIQCRDCSG